MKKSSTVVSEFPLFFAQARGAFWPLRKAVLEVVLIMEMCEL
jgi:hypothetical protein